MTAADPPGEPLLGACRPAPLRRSRRNRLESEPDRSLTAAQTRKLRAAPYFFLRARFAALKEIPQRMAFC